MLVLAGSLDNHVCAYQPLLFEVAMSIPGCWSKYILISRVGRVLPQTHYDSDVNVHLPPLTRRDSSRSSLHLVNSYALAEVTSLVSVRNERVGADHTCFLLLEILACLSLAKGCGCFTAISFCLVTTAVPAGNRPAPSNYS